MGDSIHLVYGSDDNYIYPTMVSAASAACQLGDDREMVIHLFDAGVSDPHYDEYKKTVEGLNGSVTCVRHHLSPDMFEGFGAWRGSVVTYSRMFMCEILSDLDWAIYFDGDTIWTGDIGKLWDLRDESKLVLASIDPPMPNGKIRADTAWYKARGYDIPPEDYLCMGLMLANLKKMREKGVAEKCREFMRKYPAPQLVDQTVLNCVCCGHIAPLPPEWGVFSMWHGTADLTKDGAIHYVCDVPWRRDKLNRLLSDVVLVWYEFCRIVLGDNNIGKKIGLVSRIWRRLAFVFLKHNQWILALHPYLKGRLRNTHGLRKEEWLAIIGRFSRRAKMENGNGK